MWEYTKFWLAKELGELLTCLAVWLVIAIPIGSMLLKARIQERWRRK